MSQEPGDPPLFVGFSEFGAAIAEFVADQASARGAILTDEEGDPIDFAHHPGEVTALDLQIAGAQVEQTTTRVTAWCARQGLGACEILIEASHGLILSAAPGHGCVLSSLHERRAAVESPGGDDSPPAAADAEAIDPDALLAGFAALRRRIGALIA